MSYPKPEIQKSSKTAAACPQTHLHTTKSTGSNKLRRHTVFHSLGVEEVGMGSCYQKTFAGQAGFVFPNLILLIPLLTGTVTVQFSHSILTEQMQAGQMKWVKMRPEGKGQAPSEPFLLIIIIFFL